MESLLELSFLEFYQQTQLELDLKSGLPVVPLLIPFIYRNFLLFNQATTRLLTLPIKEKEHHLGLIKCFINFDKFPYSSFTSNRIGRMVG